MGRMRIEFGASKKLEQNGIITQAKKKNKDWEVAYFITKLPHQNEITKIHTLLLTISTN